jgi:uncharacterized protein
MIHLSNNNCFITIVIIYIQSCYIGHLTIKVSDRAKIGHSTRLYAKPTSYERFMKHRSPCETAVWQILPTIRSAVAKELTRLGLSQMSISERLGITQPAVSQYVTSKRGTTIAVSDSARCLVQSLAEDIARGKNLDLTERMCEICTQIQGDEKCTIVRQFP